jgi:SAM-dependent methyltransferase
MATALLTLALILSVFVLVFLFFFPLGRGAVFVPSTPGKAVRMAMAAGAAPGQRAADLGSGDGRILIALARRGAEAHGYEVNPVLVLVSRAAIHRAGLGGRAFVHWKSFWRADLSRYDAITLFQGSFIMRRLERKIRRELRPGACVISDFWAFPTIAPETRNGTLYRYRV